MNDLLVNLLHKEEQERNYLIKNHIDKTKKVFRKDERFDGIYLKIAMDISGFIIDPRLGTIITSLGIIDSMFKEYKYTLIKDKPEEILAKVNKVIYLKDK